MRNDQREPEPTQPMPTTDGDALEVGVPTRDVFVNLLDRVAPGLRKPLGAKDQPHGQSESD